MSTILSACNIALQQRLYAVSPAAAGSIRPFGALSFVIQQALDNPVSQSMVTAASSEGKYKKYQFKRYKKTCEDRAGDFCGGTGTTNQLEVIDRYLSKITRSNVVAISEADMRGLCDDNINYISQGLVNEIDHFLQKIDKAVLAELNAHKGKFLDGSSIKPVPLLNAQYQATNFGVKLSEELNVLGFPGRPHVIGGTTLNTYLNANNSNTNPNTNIARPFDAHIDYNINSISPSTSENLLVVADGLVNFVTYSLYSNILSNQKVDVIGLINKMRASETPSHYNGVLDLLDYLPALKEKGLDKFLVDFRIRYEACANEFEGTYFWEFFIHWDLWIPKPDLCESEDVTGIFHWQVCVPEIEACAPVVALPPPPPKAVRCINLPCAVPGDIYDVRFDDGNYSVNNLVPDLVSLANALNGLLNGTFIVQGTQLQYIGAANSIFINGAAATFVDCLQGSCYCVTSVTPLTAAQLAAYPQLGGVPVLGTIQAVSTTAAGTNYVFTPNAGTTVALTKIKTYSTAQNDGLTWAICPTCA